MNTNKGKERFINNAIDKMFSLAGHQVSHQDFKRKTIHGHVGYDISEYQQNEFQRWFLNKIQQDKLVGNQKEAENEFSWFMNSYGLNVVQDEYSELETTTF